MADQPSSSSSPDALTLGEKKSDGTGIDRNFDDLKDLFKERIYGTLKGNYRFDMTLDDIEQEVQTCRKNSDSDSNLVALDVGGGLGQVTLSLGRNPLFDRIFYYDISTEMKCHVENKILEMKIDRQELNTGEELHFADIVTKVGGLREAIADFEQDQGVLAETSNGEGCYPDLVCLHAVLEWLSNPFEDLATLLKFMKHGSILSLLYYNRIAPPSRPSTAKPRKKPRKPSKLTPYHEFDHTKIEEILIDHGFEVRQRTGLRVRKFKRDGSEEELNKYLEEEKQIARVEPYCRQGRYNHVVALKVRHSS